MEGGCLLETAAACNQTAAATAAAAAAADTCDQLLRLNGFDPDMSFSSVVWCHAWTNIVFRLLGYLGLKFCWTGQTIKQRLQV
jgi:hypothetical protein|eukprot:COSAG01_NODE_88_length_27337_cov_22.941699_6_plen_83_part_00